MKAQFDIGIDRKLPVNILEFSYHKIDPRFIGLVKPQRAHMRDVPVGGGQGEKRIFRQELQDIFFRHSICLSD